MYIRFKKEKLFKLTLEYQGIVYEDEKREEFIPWDKVTKVSRTKCKERKIVISAGLDDVIFKFGEEFKEDQILTYSVLLNHWKMQMNDLEKIVKEQIPELLEGRKPLEVVDVEVTETVVNGVKDNEDQETETNK